MAIRLLRWKSIRWQLTFSFAILALLTALVLGAGLLLVVQEDFAAREHTYLEEQARLFVPTLHDVMVHQPGDHDTLNRLMTGLSTASDVRLRIYDTEGNLLIDSGVPSRIPFSLDTMTTTAALPPPSTDVVPTPLPQTPPAIELAPEQTFAEPPVSPHLISDASRSGQEFWHEIPGEDGVTAMAHLQLSHGPAYEDELVSSVLQAWGISAVVSVVAAGGLGLLISRRLSAPIICLTDATSRMHQGELDARADVKRSDEVGQLATTFNAMAARIEAVVYGLRRFVADAAHELHTPLTALRTSLELALESPTRADLQRALRQVDRLQVLTDDLLDLSRLDATTDSINLVPTNLSQMLRQIAERYASRAEQKGIHFDLKLPSAPIIQAVEPSHFARALSNLLDNALKFTPSGGEVRLQAGQGDRLLIISVQDTGPGVSAHDLPYLFDRFRRGANAVNVPGSGLGLAIVKAIVKQHGGTVQAHLTHPGMRFDIWLPRS